jgi:hypothetical protein
VQLGKGTPAIRESGVSNLVEIGSLPIPYRIPGVSGMENQDPKSVCGEGDSSDRSWKSLSFLWESFGLNNSSGVDEDILIFVVNLATKLKGLSFF